MNLKRIFVIGGLLSLVVNCGAFDKPEDQTPLLVAGALLNENFELNGHWNDGFADHTISAGRNLIDQVWGRWDFTGGGNTTYQSIVEFNNSSKFVYTYTESCTTAGWCTIGYSRIVWVYSGGSLYTCTEVLPKSTLSQAKADATHADPNNLNGGCGGFGWSVMTRK